MSHPRSTLPPPMPYMPRKEPAVQEILVHTKDLHLAVERLSKSCNMQQVIDAVNSIKYFVNLIEKK